MLKRMLLKRGMGNGEWKMENGKWENENRKFIFYIFTLFFQRLILLTSMFYFLQRSAPE